MTPPLVAKELTLETRAEILDAAQNRFRTYGMKKTTMAEIAEDVGMSAANIYRYFDNKLDLAAACASRCMGERIDLLREVVRRPNLSASDKLLEFLRASITFVHEQTCNQPKINELVDVVTHSRPELVQEKIESAQALYAEILAQGNNSGEFDIEDVLETARDLHAATVIFELPFFVGLYSEEEYQEMATSLIKTLVRGLRKL